MAVTRYLWYLYYIPLLFIPIFALFVSDAIGKSEDYRMPDRMKFLYIPATIIFLMVLTNDFHQFVFKFPEGVVWDGSHYSYGFGIYIAVGWQILCAATAIVIMIKKCRIPQSKKFFSLPLVILGAAVIYSILYGLNVSLLKYIPLDFTVVMCLFVIAIFECCIDCGLIQSNMGYEELFFATTISSQITDEKKNVKYSSSTAVPVNIEKLDSAVNSKVWIDKNTILKGHKIRGGYVFWQEDVTELTEITQELELTQEELHDIGDVLKAENEQKAHWLQIVEKNRLFDLVEEKTACQIAKLKKLIRELKQTEDITEVREYLSEIVVIGTYIKRRSNLIFVAGDNETMDSVELFLAINETMTNLKLCSVDCKIKYNIKGPIPCDTAGGIYDLFEAIVEKGLKKTSEILLFADRDENTVVVNISANCEVDLKDLGDGLPEYCYERDEDGIQYFVLSFSKDGECIGIC